MTFLGFTQKGLKNVVKSIVLKVKSIMYLIRKITNSFQTSRSFFSIEAFPIQQKENTQYFSRKNSSGKRN